jgi:membrane protein YdbS with pleckstrin-like domain
MPFPKRLLSTGEDLLLDLRPHWIALVAPAGAIALAAAVAAVLLIYLPDSWPSWTRWAIVLAAAAFAAIVAVPAIIRWATSHFVVTTERVIHRSGWFAKQSMEIPLENISDVRFHQGVFERIIGAGDLTIESPGTFGQETFEDVRKPERVQKTIYEMGEANQARMRGGAVVAPSVADELSKLDVLRRQGVITEDEFQSQKAQLLGQS